MANYSDILFGRIALENRLVTATQLTESLALQERERGLTLAEVMVRRGLLGPEDARRVQKAQALSQFVRAEKIFAAIVLERGLADVETLRACFREQQRRHHKVRIGQLLAERGLLGAEAVDEVVEEQLVRLSEETAAIEEQGLGAEREAVDDRRRKIDEMARIGQATDIDGTMLQSAEGPSGLLSEEAINRTMPVLVTPALPDAPDDEEEVGGRTLQMPARRPARRPESATPRRERRPSRRESSGPLDPADLAGRTIASRYRVLEKVGEGGMGTVYRAEHCLMEKIVALKVLHPSLVSSKTSLDRFRREIRAASRFQHDNVVQIYDAGESGGLFYMAMEFASGETLERILGRGRLPLDRTMDILRQTLGAITEAHKKGIVHRDLKAGNIMILAGREGEDLVKVMDFGLAKIALESSEEELEPGGGGLFKTQEGIVTGTPQYMSPEQASGERVDHRSDLYSLGVILFEMVTGALPFRSNTPMGFLGKHIVEPPPRPSDVAGGPVPPALERVVLRLLEKKPEDRFQTAEEVLAALDAGDDGGRPRPVAGSASRRGGRAGGGSRRRADVGSRGRRGGPGGADAAGSKSRRTRIAPKHTKVAPQRSGRAALDDEPDYAPTIAAAAPRPEPAPAPATGSAPEPDPEPAPAPAPAAAAPAGGDLAGGRLGPRTVVALLAGIFLLVVTASTVVAVHLARQPPEEGGGPGLEEARAEVAAGDLAGAAALLERLVERDPPPDGARELLDRCQQATRLVAGGDSLAREWEQGTTGREGAEKAIEHYEMALALFDLPEVRGRMTELREDLDRTEDGPGDGAGDGAGTRPGDALLDDLEAALARGDLEAAAGLVRRAEDVLSVGTPRLEFFRQQLSAERHQAEAHRAQAAGDLAAALDALREAVRLHPSPDEQARLRDELAQLEEELAAREARAAVDAGLERALEAGVALDLPAARSALEAAAEAATGAGLDVAGLERRRGALEELAPRAAELVEVRAELTRLEALASSARAPGDVEAVARRVARLREGLAALALSDPELRDGVLAAVRADQDRAEALAAAGPADGSVDDAELARFARMLERARDLPTIERETPEVVARRRDRLLRLRQQPAFVSGEAAADDRAWVEDRLAHYTERRFVWAELGEGMVQVPGGQWTSPTGTTYDLPAPFYASTHEVTCREWEVYRRATGAPRPRGFLGPTDEPVTNVSIGAARRYCAWLTERAERVRFRLPTEGEWERAARGPEGTEFPWGDDFEGWRSGHAAVGGVDLQRVGSSERDRNGWGLYDVVGNVMEMTSTRRPGRLVLKGGSVTSGRRASGASATTLVAFGDEVASYVGLRVFAEERAR